MSRAARTALLCGLMWLLSAVAAQADKRVALVVGNSVYQHAPPLPNPARDAHAMAKMFQNAGFDVVSALYDAGYLDLKRAIRQFEDAAADSDIAVVYFAGHGIEIHGVNYLIPTDAKLASDRDAEDEAIALDRLLTSLDGARRLRLVILDACRENPFVRKMLQQRSAALRGVNSGLATVEPNTSNTLIAYAARAGAAADDGQAEHSPFTAALLNNLFVPALDVRLAFGRVRDEVLKTTANKQEPFVYGSLGGANISLVPAPEQSPRAVASQDERDDYGRVEKIGTKRAWQMFLAQYPKGFYADLARENLAAIERAEQGRDEQARRAQAEQLRLQAERDRLAAEQTEKDRLAKEQTARAENDRLAKEQAERQRLQAERSRLAAEQAEKDRLAKEQAEKDRLAKEQAEQQRLQAERSRLAAEQAERERLAQQTVDAGNVNAAAPSNTDPTGTGDHAPPGRIAMLTPPTTTEPPPPTTATPATPADALSGSALVQAIKNELHRVGCYWGTIDDKWTSAETKSSLDKFAKFAKLSAAPSNPDTDFLETLRGKTDRICPLECGVREVLRNGQCVAKACPSGTTLDDDGSCTKPAKKTATLTDEKRSPTPAADGRAAAAPYDPYDRNRRVTPGGQITCGPNGCERVPVGCQAIRGMPGGHGMGGKIICGQSAPPAQTAQTMQPMQYFGHRRGGYNPDGSRRGYGPGP
jgi:uncharacterized caspase-like protein